MLVCIILSISFKSCSIARNTQIDPSKAHRVYYCVCFVLPPMKHMLQVPLMVILMHDRCFMSQQFPRTHLISFLTLKCQLVTLQQERVRQLLVISQTLSSMQKISDEQQSYRLSLLTRFTRPSLQRKMAWCEIHVRVHWCWLIVYNLFQRF